MGNLGSERYILRQVMEEESPSEKEKIIKVFNESIKTKTGFWAMFKKKTKLFWEIIYEG